MTDAAVALGADGQVQPLPKHAASTVQGLTLCGRGGASLPGMRWHHVADEDQCPECVLFLSAEQ